MGFNISGIAIGAGYENKLEKLQEDLVLNFEFEKDVIFEEASANWTDEDVAFVYFLEKSTLIFISMDRCAHSYPIRDVDTLTFAICETSMAFNLCFEGKDGSERNIMEVEGRPPMEDGTPFPYESECGDTSEIIWKKLDEVLDVPFHEIDLGAKAKKYKIIPRKVEPVIEEKLAESIKVETEPVEEVHQNMTE